MDTYRKGLNSNSGEKINEMSKLLINYLGIKHSNEESWSRAVNYLIKAGAGRVCVEAPLILTPVINELLNSGKDSLHASTNINTYYFNDSLMIDSLRKLLNEDSGVKLFYIDAHQDLSYDLRHEFMSDEVARVLLSDYSINELFVLIHEVHISGLNDCLLSNELLSHYYKPKGSLSELSNEGYKILIQEFNKKNLKLF